MLIRNAASPRLPLAEPLVKDIEPDVVANNLSLLAGTTFIFRSADDVIAEVKDATSAGPDRAPLRILERLVPGLNAEWIAERKLVLTGSMSNPSRTAADVLSHATAFPEIAIGVNSDKGPWTVVARVGDRVTVIEGGKRSTTYKTYDTSRLLNPLAVFTEPELARSARISEPPWSTPGDVDLAVLAELGTGPGPLVLRPPRHPSTGGSLRYSGMAVSARLTMPPA